MRLDSVLHPRLILHLHNNSSYRTTYAKRELLTSVNKLLPLIERLLIASSPVLSGSLFISVWHCLVQFSLSTTKRHSASNVLYIYSRVNSLLIRARYYQILLDTATYYQILSVTVRYYQILPITLRYCQILQNTISYC